MKIFSINKMKTTILCSALALIFSLSNIDASELMHINSNDALNDSCSLCIERIVANTEGVFLSVNGLWIRVEAVSATNEGVFVLQEGGWVSLSSAYQLDTYKTWRCGICGTINVQGVSQCSNAAYHPKK
jgi:hypothetical protein